MYCAFGDLEAATSESGSVPPAIYDSACPHGGV
jgi:hypothetical protein